jgi:hypothetical protein
MQNGATLELAAMFLAGCAFQRAQVAQDAKASLVGLPKEQVLACMGAPHRNDVQHLRALQNAVP